MANLARVINRKGPSLEQEREQFHRDQVLAISKALAPQEVPVKLKHVRTIIIGTHQEHSSRIFWETAQRAPLQSNPIVAWKFCHVLHKLLRDGYPKVVAESMRFVGLLKDTSSMWVHLPSGYGKLIVSYVKLLLVKLDFHSKNPFPGNMQVTDSQLEAMAQNNIDAYFQLTVEMFDYMDEILNLQNLIFGSLDMSRANSMTASGQCRLAPLIPCIQDSSHLYDYTVKIMFKLHSSLTPEMLSGHRERFRRQFDVLKAFYEKSRDLQYFKNLIQVPGLPSRAPNFLIEAERRNHVTPVVTVPVAPEEDLTLVDMSDAMSEHSGTVDLLDASFSSPNGGISPDMIAEKDRTIELLQSRIEELRMELEHVTREYQRLVKELREQIGALKSDILNKDREIQALTETNQELLSQLTAREVSDEAAGKVEETEKKYREVEQKFVKMKEVYAKLRNEHVELLRSKADLEKRFAVAEKTRGELNSLEQQLKAELDSLRLEADQLRSSSSSIALEKDRLLSEKMETETRLAQVNRTLEALRSEKQSSEEEIASLKQACEATKRELESREKLRLEAVIRKCIQESKGFLNEAIEFCSGPSQTSFTCQPDHVLSLISPCLTSLESIKGLRFPIELTSDGHADSVVGAILKASRLVAGLAVQGRAASNCSPDIEKGDKMGSTSVQAAQEMLQTLALIENKSPSSEVISQSSKTVSCVSELQTLSQELSNLLRGAKSSDLGKEVEEELHNMDKLIEDAAARIAAMMAKSQAGDTGVKLEVNGKILDSCTHLMAAIKDLVIKSKALQAEIVLQGKGTVSASEFYKRNHRWTEGLISAAKMVGNGAKCLVDAADKVVSVGVAGGARFEEVIVASQEIAASTVQLVVASRVKAAPGSSNLAELSAASKTVSQATGNVVATAKSCMELIEEKDVLDVSKLSLHQTKRLEMESQVRVLSLENELEKERQKLASLRKHHYSTAGEMAGWDEDPLRPDSSSPTK